MLSSLNQTFDFRMQLGFQPLGNMDPASTPAGASGSSDARAPRVPLAKLPRSNLNDYKYRVLSVFLIQLWYQIPPICLNMTLVIIYLGLNSNEA